MPVALEDLRRAWRRLEAEPLARDALQLGIGRRIRADRAGELADVHPLERARDAPPAALELEGPADELEPERGRLRVHAVCSPHLQRESVLLRPRRHCCERAVDSFDNQRAGLPDLERERGVDDVRGGEAVMEPAAVLAEPFR